jgi:hypothetical protein
VTLSATRLARTPEVTTDPRTDPRIPAARLLAGPLAACVGLVVIGAALALTTDEPALEAQGEVTIGSTLTLVVLAAAVVASTRLEGGRGSRLAPALIGLLAADTLLGAHERLVAWDVLPAGAGPAVLALVAVGAAAIDAQRAEHGRGAIAAGAALWALALLIPVAPDAPGSVKVVQGALEPAGAALWLLGLLQAARVPGRSSLAEAALATVRRLEPRLVGASLAACIVVLGTLGSLVAYAGVPWVTFDLTAEGNYPSLFSGALLLAGAGLALLAPRVRHEPSGWWNALAGFLCFMAASEIAEIHDYVQYWTGEHGPTVLAPIALAGGVAWLVALRRFGPAAPARLLWLLGASAWITSQVIDRVQWQDRADVGIVRQTAPPEEVLEMAGSSLLLLALLFALRRAMASRRLRPVP